MILSFASKDRIVNYHWNLFLEDFELLHFFNWSFRARSVTFFLLSYPILPPGPLSFRKAVSGPRQRTVRYEKKTLLSVKSTVFEKRLWTRFSKTAVFTVSWVESENRVRK